MQPLSISWCLSTNHEYTAPAEYEVVATVAYTDGATNTFTEKINIEKGVKASGYSAK